MRRRKSSLLFAAVVGAMSLAEAVAVVLVVQVDWSTAGPLVAVLVVFALLLWTVLLAMVLVACAQYLLLAGVAETCSRLEGATRSSCVALLSSTPTIELLRQASRRQEAPLGDLRDSLLACALAGRLGSAGGSSAGLARAAGLAAGVLRMNADTLRLVEMLEDSVTEVRSQQEAVRGGVAELRELLERMPASGRSERTPSDPVFGYGLPADAPAAPDDPWSELPEALQERLRGSSPRWRDAGDAEPDRN